MKNVHAILVLLVVLLPLQGQANTKVDSLKQLLQSEVPIDKVEVSWLIAYELFDVDNPQALFYAERAYHDVWKKGDSLQIVKVGTTYGQLLRRAGRLGESIELSEKLLSIARRHDFKKYTSMLLNSLSLGLTLTEEFGKALEFAYESLELRRADGNLFDISLALNNLGLLYYKLSDNENAIESYLECLKMRRQIRDTTLVAATLTNLSLAYSHMGLPAIGIKYADSAASVKENPSRENLMANSYAYGLVFRQLRDPNTAERHFSKCLDLARGSNESWYQMFTLNELANLELSRCNLSNCWRYLVKLEEMVRVTEYRQLRIEVAKTKAGYFAAKGEMTAAYQEAQKYIFEKVTMVDEMNRDIRNVQHKEMQKNNVRKLEMQSSILTLQNRTLAKQKVFVGCVSLLLFFLAFLAYKLKKANGQVRSINRLLDERVVERTTELRQHSDLVKHLVDERRISGNRVASELYSLISTLRGLINLCKAESTSNSQLCLNKASIVVEEIEGVVSRLKSPREN